jgi:hypothetical protein
MTNNEYRYHCLKGEIESYKAYALEFPKHTEHCNEIVAQRELEVDYYLKFGVHYHQVPNGEHTCLTGG